MCDASMGHVRRIRGPQAAGSMSHVRRLHWPCATAPWATGGWQAAVRHDTVVSRRRRRHATAASSDFFCVPFGGGANGRVSTPPTPSATTAAPARVRRLNLRLRLRGLRPARACVPRRPPPMAIARTALQRPRTPRTAIATAAALAPSTWVDSAVRSRFPPLGAHLRRDVQIMASEVRR